MNAKRGKVVAINSYREQGTRIRATNDYLEVTVGRGDTSAEHVQNFYLGFVALHEGMKNACKHALSRVTVLVFTTIPGDKAPQVIEFIAGEVKCDCEFQDMMLNIDRAEEVLTHIYKMLRA